MFSPTKPLRTAYVNALNSIMAPIRTKKVPKNIKPLPNLYVLISSETKNWTEISKTDIPSPVNNYEWLCTIVLDINYVNPAGYSDTAKIDDLEEQCINAIESGISVPGFIVKSVFLVDSIDLDSDSDTQSIERRVLTYQHWVCQA